MVKSKVIKTLSEFIKYIEEICKEEDILFRGQKKDWPLLPKIARLKMECGIEEAENRMTAEFKRWSLPYLEIQPRNEWELLAIAQHHGMATQLLDWTKNPLAGLWFAVCEPAVDNSNGVVWIFRLDKKKVEVGHGFGHSVWPSSKKGITAYQPTSITRRLAVQQGWFTVHSLWGEDGKIRGLEEDATFTEDLTKVIIPGMCFSELRYQLDRCGINSATLFPDLDGLCAHIQWLNSILDDEADGVYEDKS